MKLKTLEAKNLKDIVISGLPIMSITLTLNLRYIKAVLQPTHKIFLFNIWKDNSHIQYTI